MTYLLNWLFNGGPEPINFHLRKMELDVLDRQPVTLRKDNLPRR